MERKRQRKIPWIRKISYAMLPTLLFFAVAELGLRLAGVELITERRDPFVGFSSPVPLFEAVADPVGGARLRTAKPKLVWFNAQSFPTPKPPQTRRLFCLGGSTTYGRPYADATSYSGWLRELLPLVDSSHRWEVINAGGVSYASYRVASVMEELTAYEPDLFIVYSVHNEFLERRTYAHMFDRPAWLVSTQSQLSRLRTYAVLDQLLHRRVDDAEPADRDILPAEVDERLNHTVGPLDYHRDPEWRAKVLHHYGLNLRRMVGMARQAGADIVLITPASNEKDCSPFKSEFGSGVTPEQRARFDDSLRAWQAAFSQQDYQAALPHIQRALAIEPLHADAAYRLGQTLWALNRPAAAHEAFVQALDHDVCPLRAVPDVARIVREVADELQVPVLDFEALLHAQCRREQGHGVLGEEYFLDHVHPTLEVHRQLAMWILEHLQRESLVGGRNVLDPALRPAIAAVAEVMQNRLDPSVQGVALRNLAKVLHWSGKFAEAAPRARDALGLLAGDLESRFILADCLKNLGEAESSQIQYELLFEEGEFPRAYLPYAELLIELQDYSRAKAYLLLGILYAPEDPYAYFLLGRVHLELKEYAYAEEVLETADRLYPGEPETLRLLWQARQSLEGQSL